MVLALAGRRTSTSIGQARTRETWWIGDEKGVFEQIRRKYAFGVGSVSGLSKELGVHAKHTAKEDGAAAFQINGGDCFY
jgi:hypothetical protein